MAVSTFSAAVYITPVVIKTFFKHWKRKVKHLKDSEPQKEAPQDDLIFDQAFHIVKSFIDLGTKNTVESLQAFTNTHVPSPPWAAVSPVTIPLYSCNEAADHLIEWFGPEELKKVVGGERWWQVRGLDGVDGEWMAEDEDLLPLDEFKPPNGKQLTESENNILRMEKLESVMLYVHGGGYFWGSINTHRYQILHYAHKFHGRAFAVNYRKAPQYPWPCPLQDIIAAYLYLIRPPPDAVHTAVDPRKIVLAGDSAGGGLCITVLTILRDLGLPMPAGAVLISPWVDLTHSFPSVMSNYETDIIPKHGFMAKPSTLWPIPTIPENGNRVIKTTTNDPPKPGHPDTLKPSSTRAIDEQQGDIYGAEGRVQSQGAMLDSEKPDQPSKEQNSENAKSDDMGSDFSIDQWEPKPPKVLMENENEVPLELRSQIQMYAATECLTHPLVSPVLQGSLGNLPPLYIIAGDGEVLRDEIIYLAHKAAHPAAYPTRSGIFRDFVRQKENAEKFTTPTNVHLQVFDGMCHVLTVFTFTKSAKYAYRSIGEFVTHVTRCDEDHLNKNPFPKLRQNPSDILDSDDHLMMGSAARKSAKKKAKKSMNGPRNEIDHPQEIITTSLSSLRDVVENDIAGPVDVQNTNGIASDEETHFIRERVDIHAEVRPMEGTEEISCLQIKPGEIGLIKEAPTKRWLDGQKIWDARYKNDAKKVMKSKAHYEAKVEKMLKNALAQGLVHDKSTAEMSEDETLREVRSGTMRKSSIGEIQSERRWGPLDLQGERPPATAIAGRRDSPEAVALWKKTIYHTAPVTHKTVPRLKPMEAVAAALDPNDDPNGPPRQSVSEQQVKAFNPIHGLSMWDGLVRYFGRKTSKKAVNGIRTAWKEVSNSSSEESQPNQIRNPNYQNSADDPSAQLQPSIMTNTR